MQGVMENESASRWGGDYEGWSTEGAVDTHQDLKQPQYKSSGYRSTRMGSRRITCP